MSNNIRRKLIENPKYQDNKIYLDRKIDYLLSNYTNTGTIITYWGIFVKFVLPNEIDLHKDLYSFNKEEVEEMILSIPTTSLRVKSSLARLCSLYIDWCRVVKIIQTPNPFDLIDIKDIAIINKRSIKDEYYPMDQFLKMCCQAKEKGCPSQIIAVALLGRLGLYGESLLELRIDDIDKSKNTIHVINHETGEILNEIMVFDERVYSFIDDAINEYVLVRKYKDKGRKLRGTQLYESDNRVLKAVSNKNYRSENNSVFAFTKEFFEVLEIKPISPKKLVRSKMFDDLNMKFVLKGELKINDFKHIMKRYYPEVSNAAYFNMQKDFELCFPNTIIIKK